MTRSEPAYTGDSAGRLQRLTERTQRLLVVTAKLAGTLRADEIAEIVVDESASAFTADTAAFWRLDDEGQHLQLVRARSYPDAARAMVEVIPLTHRIPAADAALRREAIWLASHDEYAERYPHSSARTLAIAPARYSIACVPILLGERTLGVLALTFYDEHPFDADERRFLTLLAFHCGQALERGRLHEAERQSRHAAEAAAERATFLARASAQLASSLDYEQTLRHVADLAVPRIGDWCGVEIRDEDGGTRQVAVAHVEPAKVALARELRRRYPPPRDAATGLPNVLRTGVAELYPLISDEMLAAGAADDAHLAALRELGLASAIIVPMKDPQSVVGAITFIRTDPARRYTADDLQMAEQLGERAGVAITNARLYAAARDAHRLRDEFLSLAGHELRTPLAALRLHLQMHVQTVDSTSVEEQRERLDKMLAQTQRLERVVDDLLDASQLSNGRLQLNRETFDLGALVRELAERFREEARRAQCALTVETREIIGQWDRDRIEQVVVNLCSNALKYGQGTPVALRVLVHGERARIVVQDGGIGIAAADHQRIFRRFDRAVTPRHFRGLGLGLWITRQVVEMHGGTIHVESAPGEGATFLVDLPLSPPS